MEDEPQGAEGSAVAGPSRAGAVAVPWDVLGPEVAAQLLPALDALVEDVLDSVVRLDVPREWVVGRPNARHGVERGLHGLLELIETGPRERLPGRALYFGFGRGQLRAGRPLGGLLAAYHHGARATWQAIARRSGGGLTHETLGALADAIFAYLAEISAASAEGFAFEQAAHVSSRRERRRRLLAALVRAPAPPPAELRRLAESAGWTPARPRGVAPTSAAPCAGSGAAHDSAPVAVLAFAAERVERVAARLAGEALVGAVDGVGYALLPDPDRPGEPAGLATRLGAMPAALGPTVALADAAESARWARLALTLAERGASAPGLTIAAEHRADLLLLAEPGLADALARELLERLAGLPPATRERLLETLGAWLAHQGAAGPAAEQLHVHAQTVRYRVAQLRELLGARMDAAEGRLELELALRAHRLRARP